MSVREIAVPDLGDFSEVDVIEVYVREGDSLGADESLIALETDKATMDVPAPFSGTIQSVSVSVGDKVSTGDIIVTMEVTGNGERELAAATAEQPVSGSETGPGAASAASATGAASAASAASAGSAAGAAASADAAERHAVPSTPPGRRLVVLGSGPGGYTAAFRAADLGLEVTLVERWPMLGGVCLNVGCIPSKALLHAARVIEETKEMREFGIEFGKPVVNLKKLRAWKGSVVSQLRKGLEGLARQRNVRVVNGYGRFASADRLHVEHEGSTTEIEFDQCIIAAGSEPTRIPGLPDDPRIMDSTGALELEELPTRLLVIGGGIIGLEMATVYEALGVGVSVVELTETLIPGCDRDLVRPLQKRLDTHYEAIMLGTRVTRLEPRADGIEVHFEGDQAPAEPQVYERVLVAVGRRPNGAAIDAERAGVEVTASGFIEVDRQLRTNVPHIFAIGDIVGQPMLAHKATHEGKVAAEAAAGEKSYFDARVVPSVAYTDPEIAWVGLTEERAKTDGISYRKGAFPWAASGRSLSIGRSEGSSKLLFDADTGRLLGAGIVGTNAGDLIAEAALAIELGCDAADIGLTIHPHPTLSETLAFAAEVAEGTITDLYVPKRR